MLIQGEAPPSVPPWEAELLSQVCSDSCPLLWVEWPKGRRKSPNNFCRLCGTVLRGNQRRWLFSRSSNGARPDLLVILSYVLDRELPQRGDGRGEFLCGKCAQALGRVYHFDTVIARVQALSIDRLQRLLSEKDQLARSLRHIYTRQFPDSGASVSYAGQEISASIADLPQVQYQRLLQDDMALSEYECWADTPDSSRPGTPCRNRQCRSCHGLRVDDNNYEWVCRTPRRLGTWSPVFPLCRDKSQSMPTVCCVGSQASLRSQSLGDVESCSMLSLDTLPESELAWEALKNLKDIRRKQLKVPLGCKIPILVGNWRGATHRRESPVGEESYEDLMDEFLPLEPKELLETVKGELKICQEKQGEAPNQVESDCLAILLSLGSPGKTQSSHFLALESVHRQLRHLQEALKDKDADLARLNTSLRMEEETMHALRELLNQKEGIRRLESLSASAQEFWQLQGQTLVFALKEKETLIKALQEALTTLLRQIQEKEDLLAQFLAEQTRLQAEWQRQLKVVEEAASARERKLQEQLRQQSQDAKERGQEIAQLRRQLAQAEAKLSQGAVLLEERCTKLAGLQEMENLKAHALELCEKERRRTGSFNAYRPTGPQQESTLQRDKAISCFLPFEPDLQDPKNKRCQRMRRGHWMNGNKGAAGD
ncbi:hypothetical protein E2320_014537 [Naja naja]|nr:hypothetical protein E2320_014537 [Naja naja]